MSGLLVTADYGPQPKCESRGIAVLTLPGMLYGNLIFMGEQDQEVIELRRRSRCWRTVSPGSGWSCSDRTDAGSASK
jgi:hypothetical protein